jgi:hypothetical protein
MGKVIYLPGRTVFECARGDDLFVCCDFSSCVRRTILCIGRVRDHDVKVIEIDGIPHPRLILLNRPVTVIPPKLRLDAIGRPRGGELEKPLAIRRGRIGPPMENVSPVGKRIDLW